MSAIGEIESTIQATREVMTKTYKTNCPDVSDEDINKTVESKINNIYPIVALRTIVDVKKEIGGEKQ